MTRLRVALIVLGSAGMAYALAGALADPDLNRIGVVVFLVAVLAGHDALWMPVLLAAGLVVSRVTPLRYRAVVRAALICGAAVTLVAFPLVLGFGRPADNASALPLPYGRNLAAVLAVIAVLAAGAALTRRRKKSESTAGGDSGSADR